MQWDSRTILLVDDDPRVLRLFGRILNQAQLSCVTAESVADALKTLAEAQEVRVVVSDVRMPDSSGIDLLTEIRRRYTNERRDLQCILVTGYGTLESAMDAVRLGASEYLLKPVTPKAMLDAVQRALRRSQSTDIQPSVPRDQSSVHLRIRQLVRHAKQLTRELTALSESSCSPAHTANVADHLPTGTISPLIDEDGIRALQLLDRLDEVRSRFFSGIVTLDPAWRMLAELWRASVKRTQVCVTSLCLASGAKTTTALRRLEELAAASYIVRRPDPNDRRRVYVGLSPEGLARMQHVMECLCRSSDLVSFAHQPPPERHSLIV